MPCWLPTKACAWVMALVGHTTVCSNRCIPGSTPRIAFRELAMVFSELAMLDRPAARIAQQGLSACPLAGHGAVRTRTTTRRTIRSLRLHTQELLRFRAANMLVIRLFLLQSVVLREVHDEASQLCGEHRPPLQQSVLVRDACGFLA